MAGPRPQSGSGQTAASRPSLLRCIIVTILAVIIILGLIILVTYLVIRPAPIEYTVEKAEISNYNLTSSNALNATFDLSLQTNNHNKHVSIYYDSVEVSVWYSDQMVAFADVAPFHQPKRNVTTLEVRPTATGVALMGGAARNLKRERSAGAANLEVRVVARVRFKAGAVKSKHYKMKVECAPVLVRFGSAAAFQRVYCDVDL